MNIEAVIPASIPCSGNSTHSRIFDAKPDSAKGISAVWMHQLLLKSCIARASISNQDSVAFGRLGACKNPLSTTLHEWRTFMLAILTQRKSPARSSGDQPFYGKPNWRSMNSSHANDQAASRGSSQQASKQPVTQSSEARWTIFAMSPG